jgi:hypothetical protein
MKRSLRFLAAASVFVVISILTMTFLPLPTLAQQQAPPADSSAGPQPPPGEKRKDGQDGKSQGQTSGTSNDRLFFTLPNFLTLENAGKVPPLTTGQKLKVVTRTSFDYVNYPWFGFLAALGQAGNSEPGYGQGAKGYAKRYGSVFADGTIDAFMTGAIFPSLLHQDPRYFQMGKGGFFHRTGYAMSRTFVTRADSGHTQFNFSEILGSATAGGISNIYHPPGDRTLTNTMRVWSTQLGLDTLTFVAKEFWPDLRRKIRKK